MTLRRREFITLLGGAAAAWPIAARGQPTMPVIGFLATGSAAFPTGLAQFSDALKEGGYIEGRNVTIEYRWAEGHYERLPTLAADLASRQVNVIAAVGGTSSARAAKAATGTIPIVFQIGADPVELGLVASLNRPGGNLTGVTNLSVEIGPKRLDFLHELVPTATVVALLVNPTNPIVAETEAKGMQAAARTLGLQLHVLRARSERDFDDVFSALHQLGARALVIGGDPFFNTRSEQLAALALGRAVPTIYQYREFAAAGGLMSYGSSLSELFRSTGIYVARMLKGEKPADLPVQQSTKVELIINLKTAKALGITVPITLLGRADEVIE